MHHMTKKILIIDDDPEALTLLSAILTNEGYMVSTAINAEQGMGEIKAHKPDLILLDVMLGDRLGTDVCMEIKQHPNYRDIIIILLSGVKVSPEDRLMGLEIGASDYINRPFSKKELVAKINAFFQLKQLLVTPRRTEPFSTLDIDAAPVTAQAFDLPDLWNTYPDEFDRFVEAYALILNDQIESRIFKMNNANSDKVKDLALRFGFLKAGPRDIINVHKEALKKIVSDTTALKTYYIKEESRILLLEVFGFLMMYYRNRS